MPDLRDELKETTRLRKIHGQAVADAQRMVLDAKKAIRRTQEWKRLKEAQDFAKREAAAYTQACHAVFTVTDEIINGQMRLPFDRPAASAAANGNGNGNGNGHAPRGRAKAEGATP